jgi:hypothetical protein
VSATGEDQDIHDALLVKCGLPGCAAEPGRPCVNSLTGGPRDEPHMNRVAMGRRANGPEPEVWS